MKNLQHLIIFILLLLIIQSSLNAQVQSHWQWATPLPQGNTLLACSALDPATVVAVGFSGTIIKTTNLGYSWTGGSFIAGVIRDLNDVTFINSTIGLAVGNYGTILRTTDGGDYWYAINSGTTRNLYTIRTRGNKAVATGYKGTILYSNDLGENWQIETDSITNYGLVQLALVGSHGIVIGGGSYSAPHDSNSIILRSSDDGATWSKFFMAIPCTLSILTFVDSAVGFIAGCNSVYKTTDGGESWQPSFCDTSISTLFALYFMDSNNGLAFGWGKDKYGYMSSADSKLFKITNQGAEWTSIPTTNFNTGFYFNFINPQTGFLVGDNGSIQHTSDGGYNWTQLSHYLIDTAHADFSKVVTLANENLVAIGYYLPKNISYYSTDQRQGIGLHSSNHGVTWQRSDWPTTASEVRDVAVVEPSTVLVLCAKNLLKSTDAGLHWVSINDSVSHLYSISFANSDTGFATGDDYSGYFYRTSNGGRSWQLLSTGMYRANKVKCVTSSTIIGLNNWGIGYGYSIYRSTDAGNTWSEPFSDGTLKIQDIAFNGSLGIGVGDSGLIIRTTDGGLTWSKTFPLGNTPTQKYLTHLNITNQNLISVIGSSVDRLIAQSTDGGLTWQKGNIPSNQPFNGVAFTDNFHGVVVGRSGIIYTTTGGVTGIKDKSIVTPLNLHLSQNYPNPFNPFTNIEFTIDHPQSVNLKVYNLLGQEMVTLVNEMKPLGNYKVQLNAEHFPTGIYFYRLQTGTQTFIKKMLLIK